MAYSVDEVEKLVSEGIELSSNVMNDIYNAKKKNIFIVMAVFIALLALIVIGIYFAGYQSYSVTIGIGGILIFIVLMVHNIRKLQGLKRELDALYYYMRY